MAENGSGIISPYNHMVKNFIGVTSKGKSLDKIGGEIPGAAAVVNEDDTIDDIQGLISADRGRGWASHKTSKKR